MPGICMGPHCSLHPLGVRLKRGKGRKSVQAEHDCQGAAEGLLGPSGGLKKGEPSTRWENCPQVNTEGLAPFSSSLQGLGCRGGRKMMEKHPKPLNGKFSIHSPEPGADFCPVLKLGLSQPCPQGKAQFHPLLPPLTAQL